MIARSVEAGSSRTGLDSAGLIGLRSFVLQNRQQEKALVALPGGFRIGRRGDGQEIADSRLYVAGDDLRHIDRGATARTGHMHTLTFHQERDKVTHLVADFRPSMLWGMRRAFLSVAAAQALILLGWQAVESGGRVGLLATTGRDTVAVPPRGRVRGLLDVIAGLVKAHAMAIESATRELISPPLDAELEGLKRITSKGSEIVIASGLEVPGNGFGDLLAQLEQKRHPRLLVVEDHAAWNLPAGRYPIEVSDGSRFNINLGKDGNSKHTGRDARTNGNETVPRTHIDAGASIAETALQLGM